MAYESLEDLAAFCLWEGSDDGFALYPDINLVGIGCLVGGLVGWLVGWLLGWLLGWLAGWLGDWVGSPKKVTKTVGVA